MNKSEKNQFLKNVLTIFSGTTIAQIINFSAIIILQRYFYSPEEYAPFRLFFEFAAVFSSVAALRLESGLILEREDNRALSLLRICLTTVFGVVGVCSMHLTSSQPVSDTGVVEWCIDFGLVAGFLMHESIHQSAYTPVSCSHCKQVWRIPRVHS